MLYGISKCLQFFVAGLKVGRSLSKLVVQLANFLFPSLAVADVVIRFHDRSWLPLFVSVQGPSACYHHSRSVGFRLLEFAFPAVGAQQLRLNFINRYRKRSLQELMRMLP